MKPLTTLNALGEWTKTYTCVWCGTVYQVYASDIQHRMNETINYCALGDYDVIKTDCFYCKCLSCAKDIIIQDKDLILSMREEIKNRGLFPKEPLPKSATTPVDIKGCVSCGRKLDEYPYARCQELDHWRQCALSFVGQSSSKKGWLGSLIDAIR